MVLVGGMLMKDASDAPLLEGKSILAEELCVPFGMEMESVNRTPHVYAAGGDGVDGVSQKLVAPYSDLWKDENLQDFDSLRAVRDFVVSCREREKIARRTVADRDTGEMSEQELMEVKIAHVDSDAFQ